jgi:quinol monooxygenase YgiN
MSTVELTRFRVRSGHGAALLAARPRMLADFRADRAGFLGAELVRLPGDQWLDIVWWRSPGDLAASRAKGANLPGIKAFFAAIDELISSEEGERADPQGAQGTQGAQGAQVAQGAQDADDGQGGRG